MRVSVVLDTTDAAGLAPFWQEALGYRIAGEVGAFVVLVPPDGAAGGAPVFVLQQVGEERAGKNRVHVDLHPPDAEAHVAALERLGARRLGDGVTELSEELGGTWWQRMADPEGNEFCVVADPAPRP
ncbi:MAG TPA: VOC family protein [Kineosporiaceae bacterium]|nr:VOC family protein [Kineosporiaceae bacterium]